MDRLTAHRSFFANLITSSVGVPSGPVRKAFAETLREDFVGPGPWQVVTPGGYIDTLSADPAMLYQDILIALKRNGPINNGQPSLHALCLQELKIKEGDRVVQIGAGTGYYSAILSRLVGNSGSVQAYEIDPDLAKEAAHNLRPYQNVKILARSGSEPPLSYCDVLYVNAGATEPLKIWRDALVLNGRLLFPLTPAEGYGGMLLITRGSGDRWPARFLTRAMFIPCLGARDEDTAEKLSQAFRRNDYKSVKSLRFGHATDKTNWVSGKDWWLSTDAP